MDLFEFDKGADLTPGERAFEDMLARTVDASAEYRAEKARQELEKQLAAGDPERAGAKRSKGKSAVQLGTELAGKSLDVEAKRGALATRVDKYVANVYGGGHHEDLYGVGDILSIEGPPLKVILVQSTTLEAVQDHIRKACDPNPKNPPRFLKGVPPVTYLLKWLERGGLFVIRGWHQPSGVKGSRWEHVDTWLTAEMVRERRDALASKRARRAA